MTKYTAADFANARFAEHPNGRIAARNTNDPDYPWGTDQDALPDEDMASYGWVPVPTKPSITESELDELHIAAHEIDGRVAIREAARSLDIEVIPDPEPTDEELLAGIIRNIDDWQSITSPELLAKYLNTAGVTVNEEDD